MAVNISVPFCLLGSCLTFLGLCVVSAYLGVADLEVTHDKILHFLTFFILSTVFYWIVEASRTRCINMTIVVCTVIGGIGSEFLQGFLPYRNFDAKDILANVLGSLLAIAICAKYHKGLLDRRRQARYDRLRGVDSGTAAGDESLRDIEAQAGVESTELGVIGDSSRVDAQTSSSPAPDSKTAE